MAFSREDMTAYESKPQTQEDNFDPWGGKSSPPEPQVKADAVTESSPEAVTEPTVKGVDGSTTEPEAEPVAAELDSPEVDKDPEVEVSTDGAKPRNRAQERITELVDERNAVKEYNKYLQSKLDELLRMQAKQPAAESSPAPASQTDPNDIAPTLESAEFDPVKLNKLQNEWIQRQVNKRVEVAVKQIETRQSEVAIRQAFDVRTAEFRKTAPDFDVVLANPALPSLAPEAAGVVVRSANGPAIIYHLGKNPDVATRISKMDAISQATALGRLEEQLVRAAAEAKKTQEPSTTVTKAPPKVTKAPPPPKPVSGGSAPVTNDISQMSMEEWVAYDRGKKIADRAAKQKMRQAMR